MYLRYLLFLVIPSSPLPIVLCDLDANGLASFKTVFFNPNSDLAFASNHNWPVFGRNNEFEVAYSNFGSFLAAIKANIDFIVFGFKACSAYDRIG